VPDCGGHLLGVRCIAFFDYRFVVFGFVVTWLPIGSLWLRQLVAIDYLELETALRRDQENAA